MGLDTSKVIRYEITMTDGSVVIADELSWTEGASARGLGVYSEGRGRKPGQYEEEYRGRLVAFGEPDFWLSPSAWRSWREVEVEL
jgi:hypothetical protein